MTDKELYDALYTAFLKSGQAMGSELKGLSCLHRNWRLIRKSPPVLR